MIAVVRLIHCYFFGTPWLRWMTLLGVTLIAYTVCAMFFMPRSFINDALGVFGAGALFLGSSFMPMLYWNFARSRQIYLLPFGRAKLLASAFFTTAIVALPIPFIAVLTMTTGIPEKMLAAPYGNWSTYRDFLTTEFFWRMFVIMFLEFSWFYVVLWLATGTRSKRGLTKSLIALIALVVVPPRFVSLNPNEPVTATLTLLIALTWAVYSCYSLYWPRIKNFLSRVQIKSRAGAAHVKGREFDLLVGTANPMAYALAQIPAVLLATFFIRDANNWLFVLALFCTVSGAIAGGAAPRARSLWLRSALSRAQLFAAIELRFWRHSGITLAMLVGLFAVIGMFTKQSAEMMALGIPLLILGVAASTYLGLMMTRGLGWFESTLAICLMLLMMAIAIFATRSEPDTLLALSLEIILAATAFAFRVIARQRWLRLDWMLCRSPLTTRA